MKKENNAGGAATQTGMGYQAQTTVWWCSRILLQTPIGSFFELPDETYPLEIHCETKDAVDDLRVELSGNKALYIQCKHSLSVSDKFGEIKGTKKTKDSEFVKTFKQFISEFKDLKRSYNDKRLIIYYSKNNSSLDKLSELLDHFRKTPKNSEFIQSANTKDKKEIEKKIKIILNRLCSTKEYCLDKSEQNELLKLIFIIQLEMDDNPSTYINLLESFQANLLSDPSQAHHSIIHLKELVSELIATKGTVDRIYLREYLSNKEIQLKGSINFSRDCEQLKSISSGEILSLKSKSSDKIKINDITYFIQRSVIDDMYAKAKETSFIITGDAGAGKTGCLISLYDRLNSDYQVWFLAAERINYQNIDEAQRNLGLENSWFEIFKDAGSGSKTILIIDGLDYLRETKAQRTCKKIIEMAINNNITVIASIRSFDLYYNIKIEELFKKEDNKFHSDCSNPKDENTKHTYIEQLTERELESALLNIPQLNQVIMRYPRLREIVRNIFHLDLLCKYIEDQRSCDSLSEVSTHFGLFDLFWENIFEDEDKKDSDEMKDILQHIIEKMVNKFSMQTEIPDGCDRNILPILLNKQVLKHPPVRSGYLPEDNKIEFRHHLLFDYVAMKLFILPRRSNLQQELSKIDSWGLFLKPSLLLYHKYLWEKARNEFWDTLKQWEAGNIPKIFILPACSVVATESNSREDLEPLYQGAVSNSGRVNEWKNIVRFVFASIKYRGLKEVYSKTSGEWWLTFSNDLINTNDSDLIFSARNNFFEIANFLPDLSEDSRKIFNRALISMITYFKDNRQFLDKDLGFAIQWMCKSIEANIEETSEIISNMISIEEMEQYGYIQAPAISEEIASIWQIDSELASQIYQAVFGHEERDQSTTNWGGGQILSFNSNKSQDYGFAISNLAKSFPEFIREYPTLATKTLISILNVHYESNYNSTSSKNHIKIWWEDKEIVIRNDGIFLYSLGRIRELINIWKNYMSSYKEIGKRIIPIDNIIPIAGIITRKVFSNSEEYVTILSFMRIEKHWEEIKNGIISGEANIQIIKSLFEAAKKSPEFFTYRIWSILLNARLFFDYRTSSWIKDTFSEFIYYLSPTQLNEITDNIIAYQVEIVDSGRQLRIKYNILELIPDEKRGENARQFLCEYSRFSTPRPKSEVKPASITDSNEIDEAPLIIDRRNKTPYDDLNRDFEYLNNLKENEKNQEIEPILKSIDCLEVFKNNHPEIDINLKIKLNAFIILASKIVAGSNSILDSDTIDKLFARFDGVLSSPVEKLPKEDEISYAEQDPPYVKMDPVMNSVAGFYGLIEKVKSLPEQFKDLLNKLKSHNVPRAKYYLGNQLHKLKDKWPEYIWETLESWIDNVEESPGNLAGIRGSIWFDLYKWLHYNDNNRASKLLFDILDTAKKFDYKYIDRLSGDWVAFLIIYYNGEKENRLFENSLTNIESSIDLLFGMRDFSSPFLLYRKYNLFDLKDEEEPCSRALEIMNRILTTAGNLIKDQGESMDPETQKKLVFLFEWTSHELRNFIYNYTKLESLEGEIAKNIIAVCKQSVDKIIDYLLILPHPRYIYFIIEVLLPLVTKDPNLTLNWLKRITIAGEPYGLANEKTVVDSTISILRTIFTKTLISFYPDSQQLQEFHEILEVYNRIPWPNAIRLSFEIDSIYR